MANADQIALWSGPSGETWAALSEQLDRQIESIGRAAIARAAPRPEERALDVGCGSGATTLELAAAVGGAGAAVGLDVAPMLLDIGRRRAGGAGNVSFIEADAQTHPFEPGAFDLIFSRFGVMFFDDPVAAFANLRRAARPGARMVFVCWRQMADNPLFTLPMPVVVELFPDRQAPPADAPGPFALADEGRVRQILSASGWNDVDLSALDVQIGGAELDPTVDMLLRLGPLGATLREAGRPPELMRRAGALLRPLLQPFERDGRVMLPSATWIVTARA